MLPGPPRSSPAPPGNAIPKTSHLAWSSEQFQNCPQQVGWGCIHCRLPEGEHSGCIVGTSSVADFALSVSLVPLAYADISDHLGSSSIICRSVWPQYHFQWLPGGMAASYIVLLELLGNRPAPMMPLPLISSLWPWNLNSLGMELYLFLYSFIIYR